MSKIKQSNIRNFCIIAHIDHGKSTLADRIIEKTGLLTSREMQEQVLDNMELERERGITIKSQAVRTIYRAKNGEEYNFTLLATPGHVDFSAETERTMQVLDYAILVISGTDGVQSHTETLWKLLERYQVPVFLFVNKMDLAGADKAAVLEQLQSRLSDRCVDFSADGTDAFYEQVALLEKSYELAAKYMPSGGSTGTADSQETESPSRERKAKAVPVGLVSSPVVSSLPQPLTDSVQFARLLSGADIGFHTAVGSAGTQMARNTIRACVHGDQTIISGQSVRLRLLESMRVGRYVLPRNTLLTGEGRIQGERLGIEILQVEYDGNVIPVELPVLDSDGQAGIFIPASTEANAVREVAANMGQNLGTTISITNQSAGDQLLSELGRGAIQGVSQYISKKMREEKVHLKSGYGLMLYQNNNQ